ncbi:sensor histidine kinase [Candidatus Magnetaquicoccus inordinatus]|uniref:sensor histidine kinase n=1 Tax=Candidatus Magnetaquicoccus inordinatus TaxID=2496818 RepID=UPI00102B42EC|nr:ATP-binding protein [Candidatus Magnetaquicoccus inordinatus]
MNFSVRARCVLSFLLLTSVAMGIVAIYLEQTLGEWSDAHVLTELRRYAETARAMVEAHEEFPSNEYVDHLANLLGQDHSVRVTFISADGSVMGDSILDGVDLLAMENHANRPEVLAAWQEGFGVNKHFSTTLSMPMLYVAIPFHHVLGKSGIVRTAISLQDVQAIHTRLDWALFISSLLFIAVWIPMSNLSARWTFQPLRFVAQQVQNIVRGTHAPPLPVHGNDALAGLASSLNLLAEEKEDMLIRLARQQEKMSAVLQSMSEGVIAIDSAQQITLMNRSAIELLQVGEAWQGMAIAQALPAPVLALLPGADAAETPVAPSCEFILPGRSSRQILAFITPLHDHPGSLIVLRDVTERRRLDRIQREFVANVSHELRTPISIIQANAQTLRDGALEDPEYSRILTNALERNAQRLGKIITDLLELSRLEANQDPVPLTPLPLLPLVQEAVDLVLENAEEKRLSVQVAIDEAAVYEINADLVHRVLANFLDNAIKYTPEGGNLRVQLRRQGELQRLELLDDGEGIAAQHREHIFERFYRVDPGQNRHMGGTGLGLAIAKHLAERMGLQVGVEEVQPHGSLFWLSLPKES